MPNKTDAAFNYHLLKLINERPEISQRELAAELGLSLGKINYCLKAFVDKGLVKVNNFRRSDNKLAYAYLLTPKGIEEKARVTVCFFRRIQGEYEILKQEVELLEQQGDTVDTNHVSAEMQLPSGIVEKIQSAISDIIAVYVFGSYISGQIHDKSDLDLALLADSPVEPEYLWELAQKIAGIAGREVDLIDLRGASTVMRMQIVEGGKRIHCNNLAACEAFEDFVFSDFSRLNEERDGILEDIRQRGAVYG